MEMSVQETSPLVTISAEKHYPILTKLQKNIYIVVILKYMMEIDDTRMCHRLVDLDFSKELERKVDSGW
jgi:hypothetical protein